MTRPMWQCYSTDLAAALVAGLAAGAGGQAGVLAPPPQRVQQPLLPGHQPPQLQAAPPRHAPLQLPQPQAHRGRGPADTGIIIYFINVLSLSPQKRQW